MSWSIAKAKQQFSEVVRLCAEEPQPVFNRSRQVAVVVSTEDYTAFEAWRRAQEFAGKLDVNHLFSEARQALQDLGADGLELPARSNRPNPDFGAELDDSAGVSATHAAE